MGNLSYTRVAVGYLRGYPLVAFLFEGSDRVGIEVEPVGLVDVFAPDLLRVCGEGFERGVVKGTLACLQHLVAVRAVAVERATGFLRAGNLRNGNVFGGEEPSLLVLIGEKPLRVGSCVAAVSLGA